ncbi:MAG TPA: heme NO-binding domain-containing protein [Leadbetterella sp.]|nr:heme NO-binding domain-containing protein [Leadbetterella sp.]
MKGIVFTEFLEMVEVKFGYAMVDKIITDANLPSNGSYTSIGTYPHQEMVSLVTQLHQKTQIDVETLLKTFGSHLFDVFKKSYSFFFDNHSTSFDFLESIENHIHVEVKKLYPEAELPKFETKRVSDKSMIMTYYSDRKMAALAEGLIASTLAHFNEAGTIETKKLDSERKIVTFLIQI